MKFIYIGGKEFDGTALPGECVVRGVRFEQNVPTAFPDDMPDLEAAEAKLKAHRFFRVAEEVAEEMVENVFDAAVPKKRGRPRKVIADDVGEAAE
jgi:hypothetical protein